MSLLFTPKKIGNFEVKNRFVQSATFTALAMPNGEVSEATIARHARLARGEVGLIVKGALYVHPSGRLGFGQAGIHDDTMIPGLKRLTKAVHKEGGKIVFQLHHAGNLTSKKVLGINPMAPSSFEKEPLYAVKPREMTEADILEIIDCFGKAAARAAEAGADGVQIHGAHGYLVSKFLSPYYNRRTDSWGGTDENRFRFLKEIISATRKHAPGLPVLLKMNTHDYTPKAGMTHELAIKYIKWLTDLKIDALELSSGSSHSFFHVCKGDIPVDEFALYLPVWKRPMVRYVFSNHYAGKFALTNEWHYPICKKVKPVIGDIPLFLVGGVRSLDRMNEILDEKTADFISLSRPLIREPMLVKRFKEGKTDTAACDSCNKCVAASPLLNIPLRCFSRTSTKKITKMLKESKRNR